MSSFEEVEQLAVLNDGQDSRKWISEIRFTRSGRLGLCVFDSFYNERYNAPTMHTMTFSLSAAQNLLSALQQYFDGNEHEENKNN